MPTTCVTHAGLFVQSKGVHFEKAVYQSSLLQRRLFMPRQDGPLVNSFFWVNLFFSLFFFFFFFFVSVKLCFESEVIKYGSQRRGRSQAVQAQRGLLQTSSRSTNISGENQSVCPARAHELVSAYCFPFFFFLPVISFTLQKNSSSTELHVQSWWERLGQPLVSAKSSRGNFVTPSIEQELPVF